MKSLCVQEEENANYFIIGLGFVSRLMIKPTMGVKIKHRKNDHSSPIFLFLPTFSDTISEKAYHRMKIAENQ
jgi:hypothetical protein